MSVTPENFKPGERWLIMAYNMLIEVVCMEWSPSGRCCKIRYSSGNNYWLNDESLVQFDLLERLPDVESGNHQTESKSGAEADSGNACDREDCQRIRQELTQRIIREAAQEAEQWRRHETAAQKIKEYAQSQNNETR